jgi:hypothetical protein
MKIKPLSPRVVLAGLLLMSMPIWAFLLTEHNFLGFYQSAGVHITLIFLVFLQSILTLAAILIISGLTPQKPAEPNDQRRELLEKQKPEEKEILPTTAGFDVDATRDPSTEGWTDTGIHVEKGSFISFSILGEASCHTGEKTGPGGHNESTAFNNAIGTEFPSGALVAKIGDNPEIYMLDTSGTLSVDSPGIIFLAVNNPTGNYNKAEGGFTVNITML